MKKLLSALMLLSGSALTYAQRAEPIALYPDGVPNSKPAPATYREVSTDNNGGIGFVSVPELIPFFPEKGKSNGTAVVICPGGGYVHLSMDKEGYKVAERFAALGITAFVLKYRLPSDSIMLDKTIGPLQDAQRAIQIVRQNAAKWNVDPAKVGIMGFSAGGHLASTAGTHFNKAVIANKDNISLRPDFMVLIYPVVTFGEYAHTGSRDNLLGKNAAAAQVDLYSNEKQVTTNTPPTFLIHAQDDKTVPVPNSINLYSALTAAHVKAEIHIYQAGGHGFGLNNSETKDDWFASLTKWMTVNGWAK